MPSQEKIKVIAPPLPISWAILFHLLPGACITTFLLLLQLFFPSLPNDVKFSIAAGLGGIPLMWGILLWQAKTYSRSGSLKEIIPFRTPLPWWQYVLFALFGTAAAFLILYITSPVSTLLAHSLHWLPALFKPYDTDTSFSRTLVVLSFLSQLIVSGIALPITEELYFRGFLLPRLANLGVVAPLLNALFFTIQHFWQPQNYVLIFSLQIILVSIVWWKRNVYLSILLHGSTAVIGIVLSLIQYLL